MSPVVQGTPTPDQGSLSWFHIEDFSPGCYDATNISMASAVVPAPLGACQPAGTWCCKSLPGGGLGPLPKMTRTWAYPSSLPHTPTYVVGLAVAAPIPAGVDVILMVEADSGSTHYFYAWSLHATTGATNQILNETGTSHPIYFGCPYPYFTRARLTTQTIKPGTPILVFPSSVDGDQPGQLWVYPTPTHRGNYAAKNIAGSTAGTKTAGIVFCYDTRILCFCGIAYTWPGTQTLEVYEIVNFTTPPNSYDLGNQQTILAAETPFGVGAVGSISTGELMVVKRRGGGVMVNGDIYQPYSIIYLPGVQPTGGFSGRPGPTPAGLVYCSKHKGAWVWNGGNTSEKISQALRDDFYDATTGVLESDLYGFYVEAWRDWVLFSNNFLYDQTTGAWWVLYPNASSGDTKTVGRTLYHYWSTFTGDVLYAAPLSISAAQGDWLYEFKMAVPAPHYRWTSVPIHVTPNANHVVDVREIAVRASCPSAGSTFTVKVGSFSATSAGAIGPTPTYFRFHVGTGALGLADIVIEIQGDQTTGTDWSPIIHSVDVGYQVRAHVEADN